MSNKLYTLHHEHHGTTGPVVILLHGFMASSRYWDKFVRVLARNHRVITLDLLGFGKSPKPGCSRYDYDAQLQSIRHTLQMADIDEPYILIGHSMGALIALRYTATFAGDVKKLLLVNMPLFFNAEQAKDNILKQNALYYFALRPGLHWLIWPVFRMASRIGILPGRRDADGMARDYIYQSTGISRLRSLRNVIFAARIEADLKRIEVATTVVSGLQDMRAKYVETLNGLKLSSHIHIQNLAGGHHFPTQSPDVLASLI